MRKFKKSISLLLLSVYLSAMMFQNLAYGSPVVEGDMNSAGILEYLEVEISSPSAKAGESITISATLTGFDEAVMSIAAEYSTSSALTGNKSFSMNTLGDGYFRETFTVDNYDIAGRYELDKLIIYTETNSYEIFPLGTENADLTYDFTNLGFDIEGTHGGINPEINISFENRIYQAGEDITIEATVDESILVFDEVFIQFEADNKFESISLTKTSDGFFSGTKQLSPYMQSGEYKIIYVGLNGTEVNTLIYDNSYSTSVQSQDFSSQKLIIEGGTPDLEAPTVTSLKISTPELTPETSIEFTIHAEDDVSGIKSGSLVYKNEEGSEINIELIKSGDNLQGILEGHYGMTNGSYSLDRLIVHDNSGKFTGVIDTNSESDQYYSQQMDFAHMQFTLEGAIGNYTPVIRIERSTDEASINDKVVLDVYIDNAPFEFDQASISFIQAGQESYLLNDMTYLGDSHYQYEFEVNSTTPNGGYKINSINFDKGNYTTSVFNNTIGSPEATNAGDLSAGDFTVINTYHGFVPELEIHSIQEIYGKDDNISIQAKLLNSEERLDNLTVMFIKVDGSVNQIIHMALSYNEDLQAYTGSRKVSPFAYNGIYEIHSISYELAGYYQNIFNEKYEPESENSVIFPGSLFSIEGTFGEVDTKINASINQPEFQKGDLLEIVTSSAIPEVNLGSGGFSFKNENGKQLYIYQNVLNDNITLQKEIHGFIAPGNYKLEYCDFSLDENWLTLYNTALPDYALSEGQNFSHLDFTITGTEEDNTPPELETIELTNNLGSMTDPIVIRIEASDDLSGVSEAFAVYKNNEGQEVHIQFELENNILTASYLAESWLNAGEYYLDQLQIKDFAENSVNYLNAETHSENLEGNLRDFSSYKISIQGTYGGFKPNLSLGLNQSQFTSGENLVVELNVGDSTVELDEVQVHYTIEGQDYSEFSVTLINNGNGLFIGEREIGQFDKMGDFKISQVNLFKDYMLIKTINNGSGENNHWDSFQDLSSGDFTVNDTKYGVDPILGITPSKTIVKDGDNIELIAEIIEFDVKPNSIRGTLITKDGDNSWSQEVYFSFNEDLQKYTANMNISNSWMAGLYEIRNLQVHMDDYWYEISTSEFQKTLFEVQGTLGGYQPFVKPNVNMTEASVGDDIVVTIEVDKDVVDFTRAELVLGRGRNEVGNFYTQEWYNLEKDENGLFKLVIPVKEYTTPGIYEISNITFESDDYSVTVHDDRTDYPVNHKQDFSEFKFEISGTKEDKTSPTLVSVESPKEGLVGEEIILTFNILEEESGLKEGWVNLLNEDGQMISGEIMNKDGVITSTIMINSYYEPGIYSIRSLQLIDYANNGTYYVSEEHDPDGNMGVLYDFSENKIVIKYPPIEGFSMKLSTNSIGAKESLYYSGDLSTTINDYAYAMLEYEDPNGNRHSNHVNVRSDGKFYGEIHIRGNELPGEYILKRVILNTSDKQYYLEHDDERTDEGYANLSSGNYTVYGTIEDNDGPKYREVSLSKPVYGPQDTLVLTVKADDLGSDLQDGYAVLTHKETDKRLGIYLERLTSDSYRGTTTIKTTEVAGEWILSEMELYDDFRNITSLYNKESTPTYYGEPTDFASANFTVTGTIVDDEGPEYFSSRLKSSDLTGYGLLEIYLETGDLLSGISHSEIEYAYGEDDTHIVWGYVNENNELINSELLFFEEDQNLVAKEIRIYDNEQNITKITSETHDLSHLNVQYTASEINDVSGYVNDVYIERESHEYGSDIEIYVTPGEDAQNLKSAKLFYRYGSSNQIFSLTTIENEYGTYVATFKRDHEHYLGNNQYEFIALELLFEDGEILEIHTPWYPESQNILPFSSGNFFIGRNTIAPKISSFTIEKKNPITMDERIGFELVTDPESPIIGYDIHFRVNGDAADEMIQIRDMNKQEFFADRYSSTGEYTVDYITLYTDNDTDNAYNIFNKAYYPFYADSVDISKDTFVVYDTVGDRSAPVINSIEIYKEILEPGMMQDFTVSATDIGTGVDYGVLYLEDPMGKINTDEPIYLYLDEVDGLLKGSFSVSEVSLVGTYKISNLVVFDKALNAVRMYDIRSSETIEGAIMSDLSDNDFTVEGALVDHTAPVFRGFTFEEDSEIVDGIRNIKIDAEDDESGLKNIRLVYITGSVEKIIDASIFTVGEDYFAKLAFDLTQNEEWRLRRVEISDQIGNQTVLYHSTDLTTPNTMNLNFGNYKPVEPAKAPILEEIQLDKYDVKPGDEVSVSARLAIDGILPEKVQAAFWSESYQTERKYDLTIQSDGSYAGKFIISEYELDSIWTLKSLTMKDRFERTQIISEIDLNEESKVIWQQAKYEVTDSTPDNIAPELQDITLKKVEQNLFMRAMFSMRTLFTSVPEASSFTKNDVIRFTVTAEDEVSGVSRIRLEYRVTNQNVLIEKTLEASDDNNYTGEFTISDYHPSGEWRLEKVTLFDEAENIRVIEKNKDTGIVPGYGKLNFSVKGTEPDKTAPVIAGINVSKKSVELGEKVVYVADVTDDVSGIKEVILKISAAKMGGSKSIIMKHIGNDRFEGELLITPDMPGDTWRVESVVALDNMGNEGRISNDLMGVSTLSTRRDLTAKDLTVKTEQRISVTVSPKTDYLLGDKLNTEGLEVTLVYSDKTEKKLDLQNVRIGSLNTTTEGDKEVSVLYNALRTAIKVKVSEPEVKSILLATVPKQVYFAGQELDLEGSNFKISYINGFERTMKLSTEHISGYDKNLAGDQNITVTYGGKTTSFSVQVKAIELESINIENKPTKLEYIEGQELNLEGLKITGKNNDGSLKDIDVTMDNITGFDSSNAMLNQVVTVNVDGIKADFTVTIIPKVIESIRIANGPQKIDYIEGDEIDLTGLEVIGTYNDGKEGNLEISKDHISGFDSSKVIDGQIVTVTVDTKAAEFTVSIVQKVLESIKIKETPSKTVYIEGQDLNLTGLVVEGTYNNGRTEKVELSTIHVSGYDKNKVQDEQLIIVTVGEHTDSFTVKVIERIMEKIQITKIPDITQYVVGQSLKIEGMEVVGTFNDGSSEVLKISLDNISGFNSSELLENQIITVEVEGFKDTFKVDIVAKAVESIEIVKAPTNLVYITGQRLDITGLEVKATFNDKTTETIEIKDENITGFDSSKIETKQIVALTVNGKTATFSVDIIAKVLDSIEIRKEPIRKAYYQNERINLEGLEVYGTYNDESVEKLTINMDHISGFDSKNPIKDQLVTVSFNGKTAAFTVEIIELILESIRIKKEPLDLEYVAGQKLDITGLEVYGSYNDGKERKLEISMDQITGFSSSAAQSDQVITITVDKKTAEFKVNIIAKALELIRIQKMPSKLVYIKGQELDLTGLIVDSIYNDGEKVSTEISPENITGFDKDKIGVNQIITITVEGKTTTFTITVRENVVEKVSIVSLPERVKYFVGEELILSGLKVEAIYSDGKKVDISEEVVITGYSSEKETVEQKVLVTYDGKTATFNVDIFSKVSIGTKLNELDETLDKNDILALEGLLDTLDDSEESREIIKTYEAVLQNVTKVEKVKAGSEGKNNPSINLSIENLRALNIPEVMDKDVKSFKVELRSEILTKDEAAKYVDKLDENKNIIALYDMSLFKTITRMNDTSNEEEISNNDISMITLRIPVPEEYLKNEELVVINITEEGAVEELKTESRIEEGIRYLYFDTDHFSLYGIMSTESEVPADVDEETDEVDETEEVQDGTEDEDTTDVVIGDEENPVNEENQEEPTEEEVTEVENEKPVTDSEKDQDDVKDLPKLGEEKEIFILGLGVLIISGGLIFLKKREEKLV